MTKEEYKFSVNSWWATSSEFVLAALSAQLDAAAAMWPELKGCYIAYPPKPDDPKPEDTPSPNNGEG